jgi:flavin-dependent dehydrogenase
LDDAQRNHSLSLEHGMRKAEGFDLVVIGGGPAGAAAAITCARSGARVLLLERDRFPRHKVCGEFISHESLGVLRQLLGEAGMPKEAPRITRARAYVGRRELQAPLRPPALSIARYELDEALWKSAQAAGAECRDQTEVQALKCEGERFVVSLKKETLAAKLAINAAGRWSKLQRPPARSSKEDWIGLKAHFAEQRPQRSSEQNAVELFFLPFGYCGVQPVISQGERRWNVCAMVRASGATRMEQVLKAHPVLQARALQWRQAIDTVSTAPLLFRTPQPVDAQGALAVGDAAAFVDPFVGDGIAIALRSGREAAALAVANDFSLRETSAAYAKWYRQSVMPALRNAARLRRGLALPRSLQAPLISLVNVFGVGEWLVRATRSRQ